MGLLLTVVFLTVAISAACSLLEATLLSTRVATLEAARAGRSGRTAARFVEMKRNIAAPTSAILVLNTVSNTAGAAVAGSLAADVLGAHMLVAFSAVFTVAILVLSEIVPKTVGGHPLEIVVAVRGLATGRATKIADAHRLAHAKVG